MNEEELLSRISGYLTVHCTAVSEYARLATVIDYLNSKVFKKV